MGLESEKRNSPLWSLANQYLPAAVRKLGDVPSISWVPEVWRQAFIMGYRTKERSLSKHDE